MVALIGTLCFITIRQNQWMISTLMTFPTSSTRIRQRVTLRKPLGQIESSGSGIYRATTVFLSADIVSSTFSSPGWRTGTCWMTFDPGRLFYWEMTQLVMSLRGCKHPLATSGMTCLCFSTPGLATSSHIN